LLGRAMDVRAGHRGTACWAHQTLWMEMVQNPLCAFGQAE
jgi:hypothetical protein